MTNKKEADSAARKQAAAAQKDNRKAEDRARITAIRKEKELEKKQAFETKQSRKATLMTLSKADKKAFLKSEKLKKGNSRKNMPKLTNYSDAKRLLHFRPMKNQHSAKNPADRKNWKRRPRRAMSQDKSLNTRCWPLWRQASSILAM